MLNIYRGRETVDKEKFIYKKINGKRVEDASRGEKKRTLVLVPDQYTLVAEKQALNRLGEKVILDIEILSLSRLGSRLLSEVGVEEKKIINKYGRHMMISGILRQVNSEMSAFKNMWGKESFVDAVNNFISKAKQYEVSPEALKLMVPDSHNVESEPLRRKLKDLILIYEKYEEAIEDKCVDTEDLIDLYKNAATKSNLLKGSDVWVYGFDSFTPKNMAFLGEILSCAESLNIFLTWDVNTKDEDLFVLTGKVTEKFIGLAKEKNINVNIFDISPEDAPGKPRAAGISTLEKELFSVGHSVFKEEGASEGIHLTCCGTPYTEAETAAAHILYLLREKGYRLSDIVVICNEQNERAGIISRVFQEYGIGIFDDKKRKVLSSPVAVHVTAMLDAVVYGYRSEDIIRSIKTGLTDLTFEEIENLERYAERLRIKGSAWKTPFTRGEYIRRYRGEKLSAVEAIRTKVMTPLINLERIYKESKTYGEFADGYIDFLKDVGLPDKVLELTESQREVGAMDSAEETEQVWDVIVDTFMQISEIMGEVPFDGKEFASLLRMGLSQIEVGILPPSADDILLGTIQRTRSGDLKAVILLGANDGILPLSSSDDMLFSREEMREIAESGFEFGGENDIKRMEEDIAIYRGLYKPTEELWISYTTSGTSGDEQRPSEIVDTIKSIFPNIKENSDQDLASDVSNLLGGKINNLKRYAEAVRNSRVDGVILPEWELVGKRLREKDCTSMSRLDRSFAFDNIQDPLGKELAERLFSGEYFSFSPTQLEGFSHCPFAHFIRNGLKEEELRIDEVASRDIGTLYHETLKKFTGRLSDDNKWNTVTKEEADLMVEEAAREWAENYHDKVFNVSQAESYWLDRAINACKFVAWTLVEQARAGEISESRYEVKFARPENDRYGRAELGPIIRVLDDGTKVYIEGQIDRLDVLKDGRVKIIDYKTGNVVLDIEEVKAGYSLQLMLYMEAATGGKRKPAGVFYFLIDEPSGEVTKMIQDGSPEAEMLDEKLKMQYRMRGLVIEDDDVIREVAGEFEEKSMVLRLTRNKNGGYDKYSQGMLATEDEFKKLQDAVKEVTKELCESILSGKIDIRPKLLGKKDPCAYCRYHSICNFDRAFKGCDYDVV